MMLFRPRRALKTCKACREIFTPERSLQSIVRGQVGVGGCQRKSLAKDGALQRSVRQRHFTRPIRIYVGNRPLFPTGIQVRLQRRRASHVSVASSC